MNDKNGFWFRLGLVLLVFLMSLFCFSMCRTHGAIQQPADYGLGIATRSDGLHALPYWYYDAANTPHLSLWFWTDDPNKGREVKATGWGGHFNWPQVKFLEMNKIVLVDSKANFTGGRVTTLNITNEANPVLVEDYAFGDDNTRWGDSCSTAAGGLVFVNYSQQGPNVVFDCNYRRPPTPPAPGPTALPASPWWTNRFSLPSVSEIPSANYQVVELNGQIYIFFTRDSSGSLGLLVLKDVSGTLQQVYYSPEYIKGDSTDGVFDPMMPDGELPDLCARKDNGRIIVMYQGNYARQFACGDAFSLPLIIAVYPDLSRQIIVRNLYYTERVIGLVCFTNGPDPLFVQHSQDLTNCTGGYIFGTARKGKIRPIDVHGGLSSSFDGWIAHNSTTGFVIEQVVPPKPKLTITIGWDNTTTNDELQGSSNLKDWPLSIPKAVPPVILPATNAQQFFRVKQ